MTPEERKLLNDLNAKLTPFLDVYYRTHFIDKDVFQNPVYMNGGFNTGKGTKTGFNGVVAIGQQAVITGPSGGATVDSQSRTAINSIISLLHNFGFTQ
jgi:hypothetical protein